MGKKILTERERAVLRLLYVDHRSINEVSRIFRVTEGRVEYVRDHAVAKVLRAETLS